MREILQHLDEESNSNNLVQARIKLSHIVGRNVDSLSKDEVLRAVAESASENSVDGIFAPLFWMFLGAIIWQFFSFMPGPLTLAWIYKASSTIDSMIGYKTGKLLWLGRSGAKLEDYLTWIPCRLVVITLPLICIPLSALRPTIATSFKEGSKDPSPNSGLSEAIFSQCAQVQMGGENEYQNRTIIKPIIGEGFPKATSRSIKKIMRLIFILEISWLLSISILYLSIQFFNY